MPQSRSTVSLEIKTVKLARRLCKAKEHHIGRLPALDETVLEALLLLAKQYQRKGIAIPKRSMAMKPGPRQKE